MIPDTSNIEQRLAAIEARLNGRQLADKSHSTSAIGAVLHQRRLAYGLPMHAVKARGGPSIAFQSVVPCRLPLTPISLPAIISLFTFTQPLPRKEIYEARLFTTGNH